MSTKVKAKRKGKALPRRGRTSTSTISMKNQVTVPVDILRATGLEPGDIVNFKVNDGQIVITTVEQHEHPFAELVAAAGSIYDQFDLKKERSLMWPE